MMEINSQMKDQMTIDNMYAPVISIEQFSKEELADAYETCITNQEAFLSDTIYGFRLRREALEHFKYGHPNCQTVEQIAVQADLENNVDVKNACILKMNAQEWANNMLMS